MLGFLDRSFGSGDGEMSLEDRLDEYQRTPIEELDERQAIGVPNDYSVQTRSPLNDFSPFDLGSGEIKQNQGPRYYDGDQWLPANLDPAQIADIQDDLVHAGLLPSDGYRRASWDEMTRQAYTDLLAFANASGLTKEQALERYAAGSGGQMVEQEERPPLVVREPARADVGLAFREAYMTLTGRGINQTEIDRFTDAYIQEYRRPQQQAYDQEMTGGTVVEAPSADAFAEQWVRENDPQGYSTGQGLNYIDEIMSNLDGWGSNG